VKNFCAVLSSLRKESGLSQRQVASSLGVSQALLSHYENGAREPRLEFVVKACDYYNVTADYILGRSNERGEAHATLMETLSGYIKELQEIRSSEDLLIDSYIRLRSEKLKQMQH